MKTKIILSAAIILAMTLGSCKKELSSGGDSKPSLTVGKAADGSVPKIRKRERPADGKYPIITFNEKEHDFGTITEGEKVVHVFKFKNTGEAELLISKATGSCGCTVPEYPKEPVQVGETGEIKVKFNSRGKHGKQTKTVTLTSNTESGTDLLKIKASVEEE